MQSSNVNDPAAQNMNYGAMQVDYGNNPAGYQQGMDYMQPNPQAGGVPTADGMPMMMRNQNNNNMAGYQMPYNQGKFKTHFPILWAIYSFV